MKNDTRLWTPKGENLGSKIQGLQMRIRGIYPYDPLEIEIKINDIYYVFYEEITIGENPDWYYLVIYDEKGLSFKRYITKQYSSFTSMMDTLQTQESELVAK